MSSYKDHILYLVIYCVLVQHNNKLRTIENKQGRMVLVLDAKMLSSAQRYYKEESKASTGRKLSLNTCKL